MNPDTTTIYDLRNAAQVLEGVPTVAGYEIIGQDHRPALEVTVGPEIGRVPPTVVRLLGEHDIGISDVSPRPGGYYVVTAL